MKIWFDLSNSPHINMFRAMIRDLQRQHEVVMTCRPLANTIELLEMHGLEHTVVGTHYGRSLSKKIYGFPVRIMQLKRFLESKRIDVAISQSSFHSPVVARLLGVRSVYLNDNEHAMGNVPAFAFANKIMVPEFVSDQSLSRQYARREKVVRYPGVKEGIYLWESCARIQQKRAQRQSGGRRSVFVRPEPWTAQYYKGAHNFLDELLIGMRDAVDVIVLPRGKDQRDYYRGAKFDGIRVIDRPLDIEELAPQCDLFIGAGGTMTREMAVLGIPTISVYQDALLDVDRYLLGQDAFLHRTTLSARDALDYLDKAQRRPPDNKLLEKGRQAYELIKSAVVAH
jgi:predicted glycosyltransferase